MDDNSNGISKVAYELYKQNWIDTHTTRDVRMDDIRNWGETEIENDDGTLACTYEEYREEFGYLGTGLYVCYEEFLDEEYQDREFMKELLQSDALISAYLEDKECLLEGNEPELG